MNTKSHQTGEPRGLLPSGGISAAKLHVPQMLLRPMGGRGVGSRGTIPCASHEARRRMAVFAVQLAGICTRPASREALRRAAVERSQSAFLRALCAHSAQSGVKGHCPLREPRGPPPSGGKTPAKMHVALRPCATQARRDGCRALALLVVAVRAAEEVAGGDGKGEAELEKGARYAGRLD